MKKTTIGYGFKLANETIGQAVLVYTKSDGLCDSLQEVHEDIERGKDSGDIPRLARPTVFKVIVETVEE